MRAIPLVALLAGAFFSSSVLAEEVCRWWVQAPGGGEFYHEVADECQASDWATLCNGGAGAAWDARPLHSVSLTGVASCALQFTPVATGSGQGLAVSTNSYSDATSHTAYYWVRYQYSADRMSIWAACGLLVAAWIGGYMLAASVRFVRNFIESAGT